MKFSRRHFIQAGGLTALVATSGCDKVKVPNIISPLFPPKWATGGPFKPPTSTETDLASHALSRLTFGARPGDHQRMKAMGKDDASALSAWLDLQLHPERIDDDVAYYKAGRFETLSEPMGEMFEYRERLLHDELSRATLIRAVYSECQLYEVMVQFWTDHFNIDPSKGDCRWLKAWDDREVIRKHALGRFPALLRASAMSPAMLWYLDGRVNQKSKDSDRPNENYARELLELHTLGVHGGYSQRDVMEVARCLTGWTVRSKGAVYGLGSAEFKLGRHDKGRKEFLGHTVPETPGNLPSDEQSRRGEMELDRVLEIVSLHPSTANHIATKLCRRFIADEPPQGAIAAVASAFLKSQGDIPSTLTALVGTPEFQASRGNKFKRPFNFIVSALRATHAETDAGHVVLDYLLRMGHAPFQYPTPDGYPEEASPWLGTLLWRWNFAVALAENRIGGTRIDATNLARSLGGEAGLMAHILGRTPSSEEVAGYHQSSAGLALLLATPAFQMC
jgi:uncharacterized protein (DUF1800 family)